MKIRLLKPLLIVGVLLMLWQMVATLGSFPHYIFPSPQAVGQQLFTHAELLWQHTQVTLLEICLGLLLGFLFGLISALLLSFSRQISAVLLPILVISQAIPVFAIAPLLVLWFGYGMASKIVMSVLIIYFPVTAACYDGLRNTPQAWLDLAKTFNISPLGEWVGSSEGLGYLMIHANARMQVDLMFAALLILVAISLCLYFSIDCLLHRFIWSV